MKKILQTAILLLGVFALQAQSGRPVRETSPNAFINLQQWVMVGKGFYLPRVATPPTQRPSVLNGGVDTVGATVFCLSDNSQYFYTGGDNWITGAILPSQTGHANKYLGTNGASFSWSFPDYNNLLNKPDLTGYATKTGLHATSPIIYDPSTGTFHWDFTVANTWIGAQTFSGQVIVDGNSSGTKSSLSNIPFIDNSGNLHTGTAGGRLQWNSADGGLRIGTLLANGNPSVTNPSGLYLYDSTITSIGAQGATSPVITLEAQGWSTTDGASKQVDLGLFLSTEGGTSPSGTLHIKSSIGGAVYGSDLWSLDGQGNVIIKNHITGITESTADSSPYMASTAFVKQLLFQSYGAGGVSSIGPFASTPTNNGADINSTQITFHPANETYPGMLSTVDQKIAGAKTFMESPIIKVPTWERIAGGLIYLDIDGLLHESIYATLNSAQDALLVGQGQVFSNSINSLIVGMSNNLDGGNGGIMVGLTNKTEGGSAGSAIVLGQNNTLVTKVSGGGTLIGSFIRAGDSHIAIGNNLTIYKYATGPTIGQFNDSTIYDYKWAFGTGTSNANRKTGFYMDRSTEDLVLPYYTVKSVDTSNNKVLVWNKNTGHITAMYWPATAGGGGSGEPVITAPNTVSKYWNGYKNFVTLNTDSINEGTSKFFTNARARSAIIFTTAGTSGLSTYNPSTGVLNIPDYSNPTITFTGDVKASGSNSIVDTVTGLLAKPLPSLSTGKLSWNGTSFEFDNTAYFKGTDTLSSGPLLTKSQLDTTKTTTSLIHAGNSGEIGLYTSTDGSILYDKKLRGGIGIDVTTGTDSAKIVSLKISLTTIDRDTSTYKPVVIDGSGGLKRMYWPSSFYTADGTLTSDRTVSGAGFGLLLGASGSKLNYLSLYSSGSIGLYGMPTLSAFPTITDANYTGSAGQATYKLPVITANRTFTPPSAGGNALLWIWNANTSGFTWSPAGTNFKDASGTTITSFANSTFYAFMNDGTNWIAMSGNAGSGGSVNSVSGTTNRITSTGGTDPVLDISSTFEALLSKKASRIDQNNASTTSAQLASILSDETGTGVVVYSVSPALTGTPTVPTASASTNNTQAASTAYADRAAGNAQLLLFSTAHTANYTLVLSDANTGVQMNVASANTVTIPPNSSVAFPVGTTIVVEQLGAGATTATAGAGVTIHGLNVVTAGQYGTQTYIKKATDEWLIL